MRIFWDESRIDRLEKKVDDGFAETRADFRTLLGMLLAMFLTMILGFAGIVIQHCV
ncbi:MAG TPA: hypothetical protein VHA80_15160 [Solirubrobacterales bacterium]|nr:hypothetical protein [Solirubrobacterales bacterium]